MNSGIVVFLGSLGFLGIFSIVASMILDKDHNA